MEQPLPLPLPLQELPTSKGIRACTLVHASSMYQITSLAHYTNFLLGSKVEMAGLREQAIALHVSV